MFLHRTLTGSQLEEEIEQVFASNDKYLENQLISAGICKALKELIATFSVRMGARRQRPLVILAFDEARTLSKPLNCESWSHFGELRRALLALNDQSLFSLFLSTTGNATALVSSSRNDFFSRMQSQVLSASRLFTEVGFDHFAFKDRFDLRTVAGDEHISHFGRPLCAS